MPMDNVKSCNNTVPQDAFWLADGIYHNFNIDETGLNNNILVIGGTGTGKTKSYAEPLLLNSFNKSVIVSLAKFSLVKKYSKMLEQRGYKTYILDITNPYRGNVGYDPLMFLHDETDILNLAESIMAIGEKVSESRDPYWDNTAAQLIAAEISMVKELSPIYQEMNNESEKTFASVIEINNKLQFCDRNNSSFTYSSLDNEFKALEDYNSDSYAARCFKAVKGLAGKTVSCITSSVNTAYGTMFPPKIMKLFNMKEYVNFKRLATEKSALFIVYSPIDKTTQLFSNLINFQMFKELFEYAEDNGGTLPIPLHIINDDFALCKIPNYNDYISIFREAGISTSMLIQSKSQLDNIYGINNSTTIINNCDTIVYFGGMDLETCANMSTRIDIPISDILYMPLETVIVISRGQKPYIGKRYQTLNNEEYIKLYKN